MERRHHPRRHRAAHPAALDRERDAHLVVARAGRRARAQPLVQRRDHRVVGRQRRQRSRPCRPGRRRRYAPPSRACGTRWRGGDRDLRRLLRRLRLELREWERERRVREAPPRKGAWTSASCGGRRNPTCSRATTISQSTSSIGAVRGLIQAFYDAAATLRLTPRHYPLSPCTRSFSPAPHLASSQRCWPRLRKARYNDPKHRPAASCSCGRARRWTAQASPTTMWFGYANGDGAIHTFGRRRRHRRVVAARRAARRRCRRAAAHRTAGPLSQTGLDELRTNLALSPDGFGGGEGFAQTRGQAATWAKNTEREPMPPRCVLLHSGARELPERARARLARRRAARRERLRRRRARRLRRRDD